ncbi:tripartite tricarboxylate transporter TctB family protein [Agrococcus casei]|uniref:TctB citrate transporter n=1 Tax=Agrococcus casei LMG 22410 TaxID=1255656 RepID=A0A1R4GE51_9MICO|nr:tripartite tricarboxylate transporter TctB family protein [Agrococcus casei]SJM66460.1 TctB citrate transporter [Agrococcus casei LMG 22410]
MTNVAQAPDAPTGASGAPRSFRIESMVFVALLIALSVGILISATTIREPVGSASAIGARAFPYAVGGLMLLASVALLIAQLRGKYGEPDGGEDVDLESGTSWVTVGIVGIAFLSLLVTIPYLGWPIAVTILFAGAATALGAKRWWMTIIVGAIMGIVTQVAFAVGLNLSLPATGVFTSWIGI